MADTTPVTAPTGAADAPEDGLLAFPLAGADDLRAVTDILDGYFARRYGMITAFGRIADPFADKVLESHQALADLDMANLEGLVLSHVEPGLYTLVAFPLALEGADASPVRAVLVAS